MKTALVTGSEGFVGRHIIRELYNRGYIVRSVDIVNGEDARDYFRSRSDYYDLVVHCAYVVGGRAYIDGQNLALAENVSLDAEMFRWALRVRPGQVLYFSSSAAYPKAWQIGGAYRLEEKLIDLEAGNFGVLPDANYGWAKLTGERMAKMARDLGIDVRVVRPFSGYGGDQSLDYPFPSIIRRAAEGDLTVWGPPGQTRDWIHIDDIVNACFAMLDSDVLVSNLCTGRRVEMGELMHMVHAMTEHNTAPKLANLVDCCDKKIEYLTDKPTGVFYRVGNPSTMNTFYTPQVTLEEGIRRALE